MASTMSHTPLALSLCLYGVGGALAEVIARDPHLSKSGAEVLSAHFYHSLSSLADTLDYTPNSSLLDAHLLALQLAQRAMHLSSTEISKTARQGEPCGIGCVLVPGREPSAPRQLSVCAWRPSFHALQVVSATLPAHVAITEEDTHSFLFSRIAEMTTGALAESSFFTVRGEALTDPDGGSLVTHTTYNMGGIHNDTESLIARVVDGTASMVLWNSHGDVRCADSVFGAEYYQLDTNAASLNTRNNSGSTSDRRDVRLLFPGSFRPLHWGHTELAWAAARVMQRHRITSRTSATPPQVHLTYELSASVADKGAVGCAELARRVTAIQQHSLHGGVRVAVTAAALFSQKACMFPGHGFIIGVDTARRVVDPKYYPGEDVTEVLLRDIGSRGCYFVVGGRKAAASAATAAERDSGAWEDLSAVDIPPALRHLFVSVPEADFRVDISSTQLRARAAGATA